MHLSVSASPGKSCKVPDTVNEAVISEKTFVYHQPSVKYQSCLIYCGKQLYVAAECVNKK